MNLFFFAPGLPAALDGREIPVPGVEAPELLVVGISDDDVVELYEGLFVGNILGSVKPGDPGLDAEGAAMPGDGRGVFTRDSRVGVIGEGSVTITGGTPSCDWEISMANGVAGALVSG